MIRGIPFHSTAYRSMCNPLVKLNLHLRDSDPARPFWEEGSSIFEGMKGSQSAGNPDDANVEIGTCRITKTGCCAMYMSLYTVNWLEALRTHVLMAEIPRPTAATYMGTSNTQASRSPKNLMLLRLGTFKSTVTMQATCHLRGLEAEHHGGLAA